MGREDRTGGPLHSYTYEEIIARDWTSLDIFWLENLEAGLESFREVR